MPLTLFMPSFIYPLWLLLTPPLLFLVWKISRNSYAEGSVWRHRFWLILRSIIVLILISALAGLYWKTPVRRKQVLFLLDNSASLSTEQKQRALQWMNHSIQKLKTPDQTGIVLFGAGASVEQFPGTPRMIERIESGVDDSQTNIQEGIRLSEALFAPGYQKNIVLLSDGNETNGNLIQAAADARARGIIFQALYLQPGEHPEAAIEGIRVPAQIGLKQNFALDVLISSNRTNPSIVQVYRNGALLQEGTLQLNKEEKELIRLPQKITEPGVYRYEIRLKPKEDYQAGNNTKEVWVAVQGPPRILLADSNPNDLKPLSSALTNRGFQTNLTDAAGLPLSMQEMLQYQAIFLRNIAASNLQRQMPMIKQYVHDFGGGFVMLGGRNSFGPGGFYKTPIEETLPVRMDLINKKYLADVAMVIVIDKSGSMSFAERGRQKIDLADEGGARIISLLKDTDQLGALAVDSVPKWAFGLQHLSDKQQAIDAITSIRAGGGGIYVYSGLHEAYEALKTVDATVKHVILFADTADCEEKEGPAGESSLLMAQRVLNDDRITTTAIGIGKSGDIDVNFLDQLATAGNGRFYFTSDMFTLPQIFTQESALVQRYYINEEQFTPLITQTEPLLSGIDTVPDLLGYVATTKKPLASLSLSSPKQDPVLASWRYGVGQSAAFTSDPTAAWGKMWLAWPEYERFWAQLSRWIARPNTSPNFEAVFMPQNDSTILVVEAMDAHGHLISDAKFHAVFVDANGQSQSMEL
ncbi:MAG TPA: VWA domain-containing protein, partial [Acidobacteriota bacterium]